MPERLLAYFAGDHPDIGRDEVLAVCAGSVSEQVGRFAVVEDARDGAAAAGSRCSFAKVFTFVGVGSPEEIPFDPGLVIGGRSYAIYPHRASKQVPLFDPARIEAVWDAMPEDVRRVDLVKPEIELHVLLTDDRGWWGTRLAGAEPGPREPGRPSKRPFWRSICMPRRLARVLVNLTGVQPGGVFLDPFGGTASLALEAASMGVVACASDSDPVMIRGTRLNAAYESFDVDVRLADVRDLATVWGREFDGVAADLPYGHLASTRGDTTDVLYAAALPAIRSVLRTGSRAVLMAPKGSLVVREGDGLVLEATHDIVAHSKLTRTIHVLRAS